MIIKVHRYSASDESTLGILSIDGEFQCYTLEDEKRTEKVFGETRIPEGKYSIGLRTVGGTAARYLKRFGAKFHQGMLEVQNVPNFKYVLIHIGNDDDDTAGCLLVGDTANNNKFHNGLITGSANCYERIYKKILNELNNGGNVVIHYIDAEKL